MELSKTLISQFVKTTNDNTKEKKETTVYGTVVWGKDNDGNDKKYVKIDGSDILTPISSLVNVKKDDRVKVTIKDHHLSITGNLTDPATSYKWVNDTMNGVNYDVDPDSSGSLQEEFPPIPLSKIPDEIRKLWIKNNDSISNVTIKTTGYVTNSGKSVVFIVPLTMPITESVEALVTSGNGFILRQGGNYTHGSSESTYVIPYSYEANSNKYLGVTITATFNDNTDVTNVTNNDTIGVFWNGNIGFSG